MKNFLLTSFLTICTFGAFAQLTVKPSGPSGANPSYIYVKNQYIYVKQNVNLQVNPGFEDAELKASIYLRNDGQLIQGDELGTTSENTGNGYLSVYQTVIDQDSYDYTYWCPPVGYGLDGSNLPARGNLNFGALQFYEPQLPSLTRSKKATVISGNNNNGVRSPMAINRRWLHTNPVNDGFVRFNDSYGVTPGLGFTMKGLGIGNDDQLYDFRGRPNNGTITVAIKLDNVTLSGNPYPSALDLNRMYYDSDNAGKIMSFQYWDENKNIGNHTYLQNKGGYGSWVPGTSQPNGTTNGGTYTRAIFLNYNGDGTSTGTSTGMGEVYERRFAPIGQGFMIKAISNTTSTVSIKNSFRRPIKQGVATKSEFHRGVNENPENLSDIVGNTDGEYIPVPMIRIYTSFNDNFTRDMVLLFNDEATDGYDLGFDAIHPMDASSEVYVPIELEDGMKEFVISGNNYDYNKEYPVNFEINNTSKVNLRIVEAENMPVAKVYLWDNINDIYYRIDNENRAEFSLPVGNYNGRFFIVFNKNRRLEDKGGYNETFEKVQANIDFFQDNKAGQLDVSNPEGFEIRNAGIYDMSGKLVYTQNNLGNSTNFSFPTANLSDGVYLVKLITKDNIAIDYKTIVQNK